MNLKKALFLCFCCFISFSLVACDSAIAGPQGEKGEKGEKGDNGTNGTNGTNGITPKVQINSETNEWEVSYDDGTTWTSLGVKATGEKGTDGNNGADAVAPIIRINDMYKTWEVSYDNGKNWSSLDVKALGSKGDTGADGATPQLKINSESNEWEVSYDNGTTWTSLGVKATGEKGASGTDGINPKLQINSESKEWEVSYDNGTTWTSLGVKAIGTDGTNGTDAITYVPVVFKNYDGTILDIQYCEKGGTVSYTGTKPAREQTIATTSTAENPIVNNYTFTGWDKELTNITAPLTVTAQFSKNTFSGVPVTFKDQNDNVLYVGYYQVGSTAVYPYEAPFSYDATNVYQFAGWDTSLTKVTTATTAKATVITIPRAKNGEYPQSLVTDTAIINALNKITTVDDNGYKTYKNEKYLLYSGSAYTSKEGNSVTAGEHYYKVEPIQWRITSTDTTNNRILVITEYVIDNRRMNALYNGQVSKTDYKGETADAYAYDYKYSEIRSWLNTSFISMAFVDSSLLLEVEVDNSYNYGKGFFTVNTNDKVFIPSVPEIYQSGNWGIYYNVQKASATDYAKANGWTNYYNNYTTRSAYNESSYLVVGSGGNMVQWYNLDSKFGIRPSMYLSTADLN